MSGEQGDRQPGGGQRVDRGGVTSSPDNAGRREEDASGKQGSRDTTPAWGTPAEPASWTPAVEGAEVGLHHRDWSDGRWSYLYTSDTGYKQSDPDGTVAAAARRARTGDLPEVIQGPILQPPVWTWQVPLYFFFGGVAAGSSFVAVAADLAGDHRSAALARRVSLAALVPSPPLLIWDLGRRARFLNMLRVFKPRSPMSMGVWCLTPFGTIAGAAVAADLVGRERVARGLGGVNAVLGTYLGSYAGVLLSSTAVPVWARSKYLLGPVFMATATATGAAATRLALAATGAPPEHPTRSALSWIETGGMVAELALSAANERRLGRLGHALEVGRTRRLFQGAKAAVVAGLALRVAGRRFGAVAEHASSLLFVGAGVAFRYAWVGAGVESAKDQEAVARTARGRATRDEPDASPVTVDILPEGLGHD